MGTPTDRDQTLQDPRLIATSVTIAGDAGFFTKLKNGGAVTPATITLTATTTIFTSPTLTWYYALPSAPTTWIVMAGSGYTQVITGSAIPALLAGARSITYKVVATQALFLDASTTFTIQYYEEASEPVEVIISRTSASIAVDGTGNASAFPDTGTSISVRRGTTNLGYSSTGGSNKFYVYAVEITPSNTDITLGTPTNDGTTLTYPNITAIVNGLIKMSVSVKYLIHVWDASGTILSPTVDYSATQTFTKVAGGAGTAGENAPHIRLDNEARFVTYEYDGTVKAGALPITAYAYVTDGQVDTTEEDVVYSINAKSSGSITASINSTNGQIQVDSIPNDINWVEIKAVLSYPATSTSIDLYKKLYIYKTRDGALSVDLSITSDPVIPYFDVTEAIIEEDDNLVVPALNTFTATIAGAPPGALVTWSTIAYDSTFTVISSSSASQLTVTGNTVTMNYAQFKARGTSTRWVEVYATYKSGLSNLTDSMMVQYIDRSDPNRRFILNATNSGWTIQENTNHLITSVELAAANTTSTLLQVFDGSANPYPNWATPGWTLSASAITHATETTPTLAMTIGTSAASSNPSFTAASESDATFRITGISGSYTKGTLYSILITATKTVDTIPRTIYTRLTYSISPLGSTGLVLTAVPTSITIPVDANGNILSYTNALTDLYVTSSNLDVTQTEGWTITIVEKGPGITSASLIPNPEYT